MTGSFAIGWRETGVCAGAVGGAAVLKGAIAADAVGAASAGRSIQSPASMGATWSWMRYCQAGGAGVLALAGVDSGEEDSDAFWGAAGVADDG